MIAGIDWKQSPYRELAILIGEMASIKKTELSEGDFSNREFAVGKLLGYLEFGEDLLALPAYLRAKGYGPLKPNEKAQKSRLRPKRSR